MATREEHEAFELLRLRQINELQNRADKIRELTTENLELRAAAASRLPAKEPTAEALRELIERVMTTHWDIFACSCAFCRKGRQLGCRPRSGYDTSPRKTLPSGKSVTMLTRADNRANGEPIPDEELFRLFGMKEDV